ncbi:MAG: 50S ribosomal protein L11 methyltransferase [Anaerolineaceae bacterium]|nr:50S ribosomal protein L11 methyltransferase [Anaerolineaceae bacterium]
MADPPKWLEISLVASGELVEAISDVLTQVIPGGVVIERAVTYDSSGEKHASNPEARICGYLQLDDTLEEKRKRIEQFLWHLGMIQSLPEIHMRYIQDENWMEKWKEHYHPILVGDTLLILPPWLKNTHPQRIPICIDPNMAFGTGTHPTTQLSLKLLEYFMQPDADVIDIGCGSGILSIAARLLGARHALAVDIDPLAVQATLENATLNGITNGIECGLGSVREVIQAQFSIQKAPLVLANILAPVIITLINEG